MQSKLLFITSKDPKAGSLVISLGMMQLLKTRYEKVAFFRPLIVDKHKEDADIQLMRSYFSLDQRYDDCYAMTLKEAQKHLANAEETVLYKEIIKAYKQLESTYDFILCVGVSQLDFNLYFDFDINLEIAKNLSAPVVGVINGYEKPLPLLKEEMQLWEQGLKEQDITLFALFVNRLHLAKRPEKKAKYFDNVDENHFFLDELDSLNRPTVLEVAKHLKAETILGEERHLLRLVRGYKIAAMHVEHFLSHLEEGDLIIVPADRVDIILAVMAANRAKNAPCAAGILLCGGFKLSKEVKALLKGSEDTTLPIISVKNDTIETTQQAIHTSAGISIQNRRKLAQALGLFYRSVDQKRLVSKLIDTESEIMTPAMFEYLIFDQARSYKKRIVLPESCDERILQAAEIITRQNIAEVILLGNPEEIRHYANMVGVDLENIILQDIYDTKLRDSFAQALFSLRKEKGMTLKIAYDTVEHINYFATMMVYMGLADGMVSGATHTTRETIRPAFQIIGTEQNVRMVSSLFFMCLDSEVLVYADCAVVPDPSSEELSQIAISSAKSAQAFGIEPVVAMLSYSTGDSGVGEEVEKVKKSYHTSQEASS